ncbi:hypothetical protein M885DRAFT_325617 [Pelagophyceae sp. CCMP2097]|nr:hypothetical protein M885DRAFT_325617 [Pelagophyceae sp. CCMP2097]
MTEARRERHVATVEPLWAAMFAARRGQHEQSALLCTQLLRAQPRDQAAMFLKCRALTKECWVDDSLLEEEGLADMLMDAHAISAQPRPGTSLMAAPSKTADGGYDQALRPMTGSGRPLTGFERPATSSRPITGLDGAATALRQARTATGGTRPVTSLGREIRLGTASVSAQPGGAFLDVGRLDFARLCRRNFMAKAICDYLIFHERNASRALELCACAMQDKNCADWWWHHRMGRCYYRLGLYRDAERSFLASMDEQSMTVTVLELSKVFLRVDQPSRALQVLAKATANAPGETRFLLGAARVHELLYALEPSAAAYRRVRPV